jgi:hypothetical protein
MKVIEAVKSSVTSLDPGGLCVHKTSENWQLYKLCTKLQKILDYAINGGITVCGSTECIM